MPETIVSRMPRLPGYGVYACDAEETTGRLWLWVRQTAPEPYYACGDCGISIRDVHSWTERLSGASLCERMNAGSGTDSGEKRNLHRATKSR
jgi:hypothetical protein